MNFGVLILFEDFRGIYYFYIEISKDILWSRMKKCMRIFYMKKEILKNVCFCILFFLG